MLKIVIIVSNILGWNAKRTSLVQFHSVTPELAIISCQKYTQNPDTNAIFRISRQTISPKSIAENPLLEVMNQTLPANFIHHITSHFGLCQNQLVRIPSHRIVVSAHGPDNPVFVEEESGLICETVALVHHAEVPANDLVSIRDQREVDLSHPALLPRSLRPGVVHVRRMGGWENHPGFDSLNSRTPVGESKGLLR